MDKDNRTALEAMIDYTAEIERGEYSNDDSAIKKHYKYIYDLGDGDFKIGWERFYELEKEKHEQARKDNSLFALYEDTVFSDNPTHRAFPKFFEQDGHKMPIEQANKLAKEILDAEIAKSAKRPLPIPVEDARARLRREIERGALKRMSAIGVGMSEQEYAMLNFLEKPEKAINKDTEAAQVGAGKTENVKNDLSRQIPKDKKTKDKFKKAFSIWKKMLIEYKEDVLDRSSNESKPKIKDFRARVINELNWDVSERRLQTVIQLGEAKLIK